MRGQNKNKGILIMRKHFKIKMRKHRPNPTILGTTWAQDVTFNMFQDCSPIFLFLEGGHLNMTMREHSTYFDFIIPRIRFRIFWGNKSRLTITDSHFLGNKRGGGIIVKNAKSQE